MEKKRDFVIAMLNCKKIKRDFVDDGKKEEKGNEGDGPVTSSGVMEMSSTEEENNPPPHPLPFSPPPPQPTS